MIGETNGRQGFILGFAFAMILIVDGISAYAVYYMNITVNLTKAPSSYVPPTDNVIVAGQGAGARGPDSAFRASGGGTR